MPLRDGATYIFTNNLTGNVIDLNIDNGKITAYSPNRGANQMWTATYLGGSDFRSWTFKNNSDGSYLAPQGGIILNNTPLASVPDMGPTPPGVIWEIYYLIPDKPSLISFYIGPIGIGPVGQGIRCQAELPDGNPTSGTPIIIYKNSQSFLSQLWTYEEVSCVKFCAHTSTPTPTPTLTK